MLIPIWLLPLFRLAPLFTYGIVATRCFTASFSLDARNCCFVAGRRPRFAVPLWTPSGGSLVNAFGIVTVRPSEVERTPSQFYGGGCCLHSEMISFRSCFPDDFCSSEVSFPPRHAVPLSPLLHSCFVRACDRHDVDVCTHRRCGAVHISPTNEGW